MTTPNELTPPSVALALRQMLPSAGQTLLLRAALNANQGAQAWSTWRASHDLKETLAGDHVGVKGLLPLLAFALEQNESLLTAADLSLLRMARYRESLRFERYQAILQQTRAVLAAGGVRAILLKGAALALTVYPQPALRHCHDIDLLIQASELPIAAKLLLAQNFGEPSPQPPRGPTKTQDDRRLDHASGLPVELHTLLFGNPFFGMPVEGAWQSALPLGNELLSHELPLMMLAPEWELVHIVGAMLCAPKQARITWVCDAHLLIAANPALDWARVCQIAEESRLALPAFVLLDYLQQQQQSPVPSFVFRRLAQNSAASSRALYEQLLQSARRHNAAGYGELLAVATRWQERSLLWRWMLFPPPTALQGQEAQGWQLPYFYLRRAVRYFARQLTTKPSANRAPSRQA